MSRKNVMVKVEMEPSELLYPCPVTLITCVDKQGKPNIIPLAWVGIACSDPPTISIAIRPQRYSNKLIKDTKEFVVNIPTLDILRETDYCGEVSGRDIDKFAGTKLSPEPARKVKPPLIKECPVNLECVLQQVLEIGAHHLFLGLVVAVHVDNEILDEKGRIDYAKARPFVYLRGEYWNLGKLIGLRHFSTKKS